MQSNGSGKKIVDLGGELRAAREAKGISLAEAEAATRIRERYLMALEVNDWAALPTPVQARGFLRNYATYLGIDASQVLSWFGQLTRSAGVSLPTAAAAESSVPTTSEDGAVFRPRDIDIDSTPGMPGWLSSDILIGVFLAMVVAALGFGLLRIAIGSSDDATADSTAAPDSTRVLIENAPQATGDAETSTGPATPMPATPTFDASIGMVRLNLTATEHVWVRVTVDGVQVLEGILAPDVPQTWQASQQIILEAANGAGLAAVVNGQPQGNLGDRGQAVTLAWGPNGFLPLTPSPEP